MPRFCLTTLFLATFIFACAAAIVFRTVETAWIFTIFWPTLSAAIGLMWQASAALDTELPFREHIEDAGSKRNRGEIWEWRKGILIVAVIIQAVWLPFGFALATAIGITYSAAPF